MFSFTARLHHCWGSAKRVKKEDKATAGYRWSNSPGSPGGHLDTQTIFTPDYRVSNQPLTHTTIHFLWPTQTKTGLSCSLRATPGDISQCKQDVYRGTAPLDKVLNQILSHSCHTWQHLCQDGNQPTFVHRECESLSG